MTSRIRTVGRIRRLALTLLCVAATIESAAGVASRWATGGATGWTSSHAAAADPDETLFESKIRPLLVERCHKCHAGGAMKGGLKLDARDTALKGGETGPAIVPGKPDESLLLQAVRHQNGLAMPPDGKLKEADITALTDWIKRGAKWPGAATVAPTPPPAAATIPAAAPNSGDLQPALQLWLASDSLGLNDGEPVYVWPDRSGHGRDVTATRGVRTGGVGGPGKFIKQSSLLGRPAVRFDTATGFAGSPDNLIPLRGDAPVTIMVVMNLQPHEAQPPYDGVIGVGNPAHPGDPGRPLAALIQINRGEDHALHFAGGWNHDASLGVGSFKPHYGKPVMLSVVKQPGPMRTTTRLFINGTSALRGGGQPLEGRDGVPDIQHRADIGAYLGKALAWCGSIQGDVGEVLVYNQALSDSQRAAVENHLSEKYGLWLQQAGNRAAPPVFSPEEKSFWAYQAVREPPLPTIPTLSKVDPMSKVAKASYDEWIKTPVDRFVLQKLDERRLAPAPQADKLTLLRRATFDLTGLPPSPEEVEAFVADDSPQAFEKVVNRLLDSPHYGERWGRHWLDVVRYAESTANDANAVMRFAWRYRNYVIDAFNRDLPYDQFLIEQLAGDLLPATDDVDMTTRRIVATGFLMVGPKALAETDKEQSRLDIVDDQIDVTGRAMLGLTLACARCHDHKFDAIRATDYYALAGIFRSTEPFQDENRNATMWWEFPVPQGAGKEPIVVMAPKESAPRNLRVHLRGNRFTLGPAVPRGFLQVVEQVGNRGLARPSQQLRGGITLDPNQLSSGRLELARWIASPENPLTARVMVNRVWQHHFGRGLVATSDNFGTRGERPSHPELLDWLAARFVAEGWSVKQLHRWIMLSSSYQQTGTTRDSTDSGPAKSGSSAADASVARRADPDRVWLSSFARRRLSAEELRDAMLAVSGKLDRKPGAGESGEFLFDKAENIGAKIRPNRVAADDPFYSQFAKRTVYLPVVRNMLPDVLSLFDAADPNGVTANRNETTVASQSLFLLNSPFVRDQSAAFAERLLGMSLPDDDARLDRAHQLAFGRRATTEELADARQFLAAYLQSPAAAARPEPQRRLAAWQSFCQTLFCSNEFLYVE